MPFASPEMLILEKNRLTGTIPVELSNATTLGMEGITSILCFLLLIEILNFCCDISSAQKI